MSLFQNINTNVHREGVRCVIAGNEKMGKTTLVAGAPGPLLVPLEIGYAGISIPKTPMVQEYNEVETFMKESIASSRAGRFPFKTLIFDSATALERLIHDDVLTLDPAYKKDSKKTVSMETALGGFSKAYGFANERFNSFLKQCDLLAVYGGVNIVLTCHVFASTIVDPVNGEYDSWDLLLHSPKNQKSYGKREILTQWADVIGFLYEPIFVSKTDNISKGMSQNKGRMLALSRTPSCVAGNRFGFEGEISVPKEDGWNHLAHALYQSSGVDMYRR